MRSKLAAVVLLLCVSLARTEDKFPTIDKSNRNATFLVKTDELVMEISTGSPSDYPPFQGANDFNLMIGTCELEIKSWKDAESGTESVIFLIGTDGYTTPTELQIKDGQIRIDSVEKRKPMSCKSGLPAFTKLTEGGFTILVSLDGNIPNGLKLTAKDAKIYGQSASEDEKNKFPVWAIILIPVGLVILIAAAIGLAVFFIRRRKQRNQQEQEPMLIDPEIEAPKPITSVTSQIAEPIQIEIPKAKVEESEKKKSGESKATEAAGKNKSNKDTEVSKQPAKEDSKITEAAGKKQEVKEKSKDVGAGKKQKIKKKSKGVEEDKPIFFYPYEGLTGTTTETVANSKDQVEEDIRRFHEEKKKALREESKKG